MNGYRCLKVVGGDGCVNVNVLSDEWGVVAGGKKEIMMMDRGWSVWNWCIYVMNDGHPRYDTLLMVGVDTLVR